MLDVSEIRALFAAEKIEILEPIAQGGMADVFKGKQLVLDRLVAVKVLRLQQDSDLLRFQNEAKLLSTLEHPSIVKTLSFGVLENTQPFMVLEYIDGITFSLELERGPLSLRRFRDVFMPLLSALNYAHENGLVHRDIKPSNIMVNHETDENEFVKILDFGIARLLTDDSTSRQHLTKTGVLLGSPSHMSPEQCMGKNVDSKSDVYSLSCVMFEALYGRPLFVAGSALELMSMHLHNAPPSVSELSRDFESSERIAELILSGLSKEPEARPSASEFSSKLQRILDSTTLNKIPTLRAKKTEKKKLSLIVALLLFLATSGVIAKLIFDRNEASNVVDKNLQEKDLAPSTLMSRGRSAELNDDCQQAITLYEAALHAAEQKRHHEAMIYKLNISMAECCMRLYQRNTATEIWFEKGRKYCARALKTASDKIVDTDEARGRFMDACRAQCLVYSFKPELCGRIPEVVILAERMLHSDQWDLLEVELDAFRKLMESNRADLAEPLAERMLVIAKRFGEDSYPFVRTSANYLLILSHKKQVERVKTDAARIAQQLILSPHKTFTADRRLSVLANTIFMALCEVQAPQEIEKLIHLNEEVNPGDGAVDPYQYGVCYYRLGNTYISMKNWKKAIPALRTGLSIMERRSQDSTIRKTCEACLGQLSQAYRELGLTKQALECQAKLKK